MNKLIYILIALIIIVGGYFFVKRGYRTPVPLTKTERLMPIPKLSQQIPPYPVLPVISERVVTYAAAGFSPNTLTIKKGGKVIFKNEGSSPMRPASGIHPTHRLYPTTGGCIGSTFDACGAISPNQSWSFIFDIPGTWKYHDHLNPSKTGTIIVE